MQWWRPEHSSVLRSTLAIVVAGVARVAVARLTAVAKVSWQSVHVGSAAAVAHSVAATAKQILVAAQRPSSAEPTKAVWGHVAFATADGKAGADGARVPLLARADWWGFAACEARGACSDHTWQGCDDEKPCTLDSCNPKVGCEHAAPTGLACAPGDACSTVGRCEAAVCVAGHNGLLHNVKSTWGSLEGYIHRAVAPASDGGLTTWATANNKPILRQAHNAYGQSSAPTTVGTCPSLDRVQHIEPMFDGGLMLTGHEDFPNGHVGGGHCRLDKDGKVAWHGAQQGANGGFISTYNGTSNSVEYVDGHVFVVGARRAAPQFATQPWSPVLQKFTPAGKRLWAAEHSENYWNTGASNAVGTDDGGVITVGRSWHAVKDKDGESHACIFSWGHDGKERFFKRQPYADGTSGYWAVTIDKQGRATAVGRVDINTSAATTLVAAHDAKTGTRIWHHQTQPLDNSSLHEVLPTDDGGTVVAGQMWHQARKKILLRRLDANGKAVWERRFLSGGTDDVTMTDNGLAAWSGGYVLVGYPATKALPISKADNGAPGLPVIIKTDLAGYAGCADAGGCLEKKPADCDDKNACTIDWCDAKDGCRHVAVMGCK